MKNIMTPKSNMYATAKTWSPFKGCEFDCTYCKPSFQLQAKRQKHLCGDCYNYVPHCHPERLAKIPSAEIVFVAGNGDIAFCPPDFLKAILATIKKHNERCPYKTYYLQSKEPQCLVPFLDQLPPNIIIVTTLETNRDEGYELVSKASLPSERYQQFLALNWPRKVVTIEPVMDFDEDVFKRWLLTIKPEYVWLGLNSRTKQVQLPEPSAGKLTRLVKGLQKAGVALKLKEMRGIV